MKVLVQLGHPAHFHLYKNVIRNLQKDGHSVYVLIQKKDILEELLIDANIPYVNILPNRRKSTKYGIAKAMCIRFWKIFWFSLTHSIDLLIGSATEVAQVAWIQHRQSIVFAEDDAALIPQFIRIVKPFVDTYMSPVTCNNGVLELTSIKYAGYHKLAYLHPNRFVPDKNIVEKYFSTAKPYFLLRFAQLKAYHDLDVNAHGINTEIAQHLIDILEPYGNIYITSERELEPQFEQYRLRINPLEIHHVMSFATLYIGDSQSMAVESAMLGVPSIRFNDFAGKIGVLEELEHKYGLTFGIKSSEPEKMYAKIDELLAMQNLRDEFQSRRQKMLTDKIDVTAFFTWFIENYPESKKIMQENPDYQYRFK